MGFSIDFRKSKLFRQYVFFLFVTLISSCTAPNLFRSPTPTPTSQPTITPTPYLNTEIGPLGSESNPIILGYVNTADDDTAVNLAGELSEKTGYAFAINQYQFPIDLLREMKSGSVQFAWLSPLAYVYAHQNAFGDILLISNHYGVYGYGTQFLANKDSQFSVYYDENQNQITGDAADALAQFEGKSACFLASNSLSGYIVPMGLLNENSVKIQSWSTLQGHTAIIRALYIKDICDFGMTFSHSGDPRTAPSLQDIPDVRDKIQVIWRTDPFIPSDGLAVKPEIPIEMRDIVKDAFLEIVKTDDGRLLFSNTFDYDIQNLIEAQETLFDPLRDLIIASQINMEETLSH